MDDDLRLAILAILRLHRGIRNRIPRARLRVEVCARLNRHVSDRELRRKIHEMREQPGDGSMICSTCGSLDEEGRSLPARAGLEPGGYFMVTTHAELTLYLKPDENRALDTLQSIRKQKLAAGMALTGAQEITLPGGAV